MINIYSKWHSQAFASNLVCARNNFRLDCCNDDDGFQSVLGKTLDGYIVQQAKVYKMLDGQSFPLRKAKLDEKIRKGIDRFKFGIPLGILTRRAIIRLEVLRNKVKPAVLVVYFRTILNGWVTSRRMRSLHGQQTWDLPRCVFCKLPSTCDSLEHMMYCGEVRKVFARFRSPITYPLMFFALDHGANELQVLIPGVKALATVYSMYNTIKHHPPTLPALSLTSLLNAACLPGV